jgi:cysteine sulfinate desulfinase/cysteine desulfurase-like protein
MSERRRIYLDNNATTPMIPESSEAVCDAMRRLWGNPSALYAEGKAARDALEWARGVFAKFMNVKPETIYFTSCGTESNNIALRGVMGASPRGRDVVVTSSVEHSSIRKTADACGFKHIMVPVDRQGYVDEGAYRSILTSNARNIGLISIIMGQNEVGTLQRIPALVKIARELLGPTVPFHTDATQVLGKYYVHPDALGVDMLTGSAHKFHGPRGVGILYSREGILTPTKTPMTGGGQERGCRSGTENVPSIIGAAVAFKHALNNESKWERRKSRVKTLRNTILASLVRGVPGLIVNGDPQRGLYNTLNVSFPGAHGHAMVDYMDRHGISVGSGSACSKGKPSEVLVNMMGHTEVGVKIAHAAIRISLSSMNNEEECQIATGMLVRAWRASIAPTLPEK